MNARIIKWSHDFKVYANSYNVKILNSFNSELQPKDTASAIRDKLIELLSESKDFKLVTTLVLEFRNIKRDNKTLYNTFYLNSRSEIIINERYIDDSFESTYSTIVLNI